MRPLAKLRFVLLAPLALAALVSTPTFAQTEIIIQQAPPPQPGPLFWLGVGGIAIFGLATIIPGIAVTVRRFHDRDMYIFALDASGVYRAFGGKPEKVGSRVQDIAGIDGNALLASIIEQAEHGPGWVEYDIVNPVTGAVQAKMSYVVKVDDLYLGCGVYKTVAARAAA